MHRLMAAHSTHQAYEESGKTTKMTAGVMPHCETAHLPARRFGRPPESAHPLLRGQPSLMEIQETMAGWVGHMAALLQPLAERIARHVRAGAALHADDTPVPVLDPGRGRTKTGRLWTAVRDESPYGSTAPPAAFYLYSPDRKAERAHALLKGCRG